MSPEQKAAYVFSQAACMLVELEAMKLANFERAQAGAAPAYGEQAFRELPDKYALHHNDVVGFMP